MLYQVYVNVIVLLCMKKQLVDEVCSLQMENKYYISFEFFGCVLVFLFLLVMLVFVKLQLLVMIYFKFNVDFICEILFFFLEVCVVYVDSYLVVESLSN